MSKFLIYKYIMIGYFLEATVWITHEVVRELYGFKLASTASISLSFIFGVLIYYISASEECRISNIKTNEK